jgi:hypothetical protein
MSLLDDHVRRFNEGVRSGDFAPMVAAFTEDGELHFEGVRIGPFVGRYSWLRDEGRQAGEMRLTPRDGRIQKLVVTFG